MLTIRPVRATDAPAVERICLLTGDAGASAEHLHASSRQNLLGAVWAVPYVLMPHTWGFVLVDEALDSEDGSHASEAVKGYVLGAADSEAFARAEEEQWWPALRARYSLTPSADETEPRTAADQRYIDLIHRAPDPPSRACLALSPAHMHIDLLPEVQRQGWGRRLIGRAVDELRARGIDAVWLGMDPKNVDAARFYDRLGFEKIEGESESMRVLRFTNWK